MKRLLLGFVSLLLAFSFLLILAAPSSVGASIVRGGSSVSSLPPVGILDVASGPLPRDQEAPPLYGLGSSRVYFPIVRNDRGGLWVNLQDRQASLDFYNQQYRPMQGYNMQWTGNHEACDEGTLGQEFRDAVLRRVNYFRAMAGVPADITFIDEYNRKAQKAALMMSVNRSLSHFPENNWRCYSEEGAEAARHSNLTLGNFTQIAMDAYMGDGGANNAPVGHRRWILYPQTRNMGTGHVHPAPSETIPWQGANALWVIDNPSYFDARPATRDGYVAWPPPGYVPFRVVYPRWSFSYPNADFSTASVSMTTNNNEVPVALEPIAISPAERTLVWIPHGMNHNDLWPRPTADTVYTVSINHVWIGGEARNFVYQVVVFDPES